MGEVNESPKDIDLKNNFRNFFWEKKKVINFFMIFYISHESNIKNFPKIVY